MPITRLLLRTAICLVISISLSYGATVNIDLNTTRQTIRGFGGMNFPRWIGTLTNAQVDTAFGNGPGQIGFTIMRIDVPPDSGAWSGEISAAVRAKSHGAIIFASPWSPPASMKSNGSTTGGYLLPSSYGDYADHLTDFTNYMSSNGASLYAISLQNEADFEASYESCVWTSSEMRDFLDNNASVIPTKVIAPETVYPKSYWYSALSSAPELDIYADHLYGGSPTSFGKEHWMTEHLVLDTNYPAVLETGKEIHDCMVDNYSAYIWWYIRRYYGPMDEDGTVTKRGYVMSQYSKFVRPGYIRVDATANPSYGVYVTAYKSPDNNELSVVLINTNSVTDVELSLSFTGFVIEEGVVYRTSETENCVVIGVYNPSNSLTLPAESITTLTLSGDSSTIPPLPPTGLSTMAGNEWVSLDWDDNIESDANGYNVYRSTTTGSGYSKLNSSLVSDSNYLDQTVVNDTTYYYVLTAVDTYNNESSYSLEVSATPYDGNFPRLYFCSFENGDFEGGWEGWTNLTGDDDDWIRHYNETPTSRTGPDSGANGSTWYVYLETSSGHANDPGDTAILEGPEIGPENDRVLGFYYHMYGTTIGTLYVDVYDSSWHEGVWSLSGPQQSSESDPYSKATVYLNNYTGPIKIRFRAVAAGGATGDMAIDDIDVVCDRSYGEFTGDTVFDNNDLNIFGGRWLVEDCNDPDGLDLDGNCMLNFYEYSLMAENWLE